MLTPSRAVPLLALLFCLPALSSAAEPVTPAAAQPAATNEGAISAKTDPAAENFWQALKLLRSSKLADLAAGRTLLQSTSDREFTHAQVFFGNCLLSGSYGIAKDPRKAVNLFRLAAERGNGFAKVSLGTCYATGTGVRKDEAKAVEWLTAALLSNADFSRPIPPADFFQSSEVAGFLDSDPVSGAQASAHFLLGQISSRHNQLSEAHVHYIAAATAGPDGRSGIYQAAVEAAMDYAFGKGTARDRAKANAMLDHSRQLNARMGVGLIHNNVALKIVDEFAVADLEEAVTEAGIGYQSAVQYQIAQSLADKKSKDYNPVEAAKWYEFAAQNGQAWAMLSLALLYAHGDLGQPDPAKAFSWFEKAGDGEKPKHILGVANLAICLQHGIGTAKDEARAVKLFNKNKDFSFACYLGSIGQAPTRVLSQEEELTLNQNWASNKNDAQAQFILGSRCMIGFGVPANLDEAKRWFKLAAKAKHGGALCQLGWLYQFYPQLNGFTDPQKALRAAAECYQASGEAGNIEGLANYAYALFGGFGVEKNEEKAIALYGECLKIDPTHSRTHSNLAGIYNAKIHAAAAAGVSMGTIEWRQLMIQHYEASVRQELSYGAISLGDLYYEGHFIAQDFKKAYAYYEQATAVPEHKAEAHFRLGYMHEYGQGVPVTYTEAAYHYHLAALDGNIPSLDRLSKFYLSGQGVTKDLDRAIYWLTLLVKRGHMRAQTTLCDVLMQKGDYAAVLPELKRLSDLPNAELAGFACERLSQCYEKGLGVKADHTRAKNYLSQAIQWGNADALTRLAMMQLRENDKPAALASFQRAAQTSPKARFQLGQMYYFGTNVEKDEVKALQFIGQAAKDDCLEALVFIATMTLNNAPGALPLEDAITLAQKAEACGFDKAQELREKLEQRRLAAAEPEANTTEESSL